MSTADWRFTVHILMTMSCWLAQTTMQEDLTQRGHGVTVLHLADAQFIQAWEKSSSVCDACVRREL